MSYEQFWYGEPRLAEVYRKANNYEIERRNQELWMQGLYNFNAFGAVIENFSNGLAGRRVQARSYLKEPIRITPLSEDEEALRVKREREKAIKFFTDMKKSFDKKEAMRNAGNN